MSYSVLWSEPAIDDFDIQLAHIAHESPQNATLVIDRIERTVESLRHLPTVKDGRVEGTFEKVIPKTSLILVYRMTGQRSIEIARLVHTSRNWKSGEFPE